MFASAVCYKQERSQTGKHEGEVQIALKIKLQIKLTVKKKVTALNF